jgi:hypothetical protein
MFNIDYSLYINIYLFQIIISLFYIFSTLVVFVSFYSHYIIENYIIFSNFDFLSSFFVFGKNPVYLQIGGQGEIINNLFYLSSEYIIALTLPLINLKKK